MIRTVSIVLLIVMQIGCIGFHQVGGEPTLAQSLTMEVHPGTEECFYQPMGPNRTLTIDYAVVSTSQGGHDINFQLLHPNGRPIVTEFRKAASTPTVSTQNGDGIYRFCFDNTFSHISRKKVTFTVVNEDVNSKPVDWEAYDRENLKPEEIYSVTVQEIMRTIDAVRLRLNEIQVIQDNYRVMETRDRTIAETNYERVNFMSLLTMFMMVFVGGFQVFIVRTFFEDKYKVIYSYLNKKLGK